MTKEVGIVMGRYWQLQGENMKILFSREILRRRHH